MERRVAATVVLYAAAMLLLFHVRPSAVFLPDGTPRPFGTHDAEATLTSLGVLAVVLAFASYFVASLGALAARRVRRVSAVL